MKSLIVFLFQPDDLTHQQGSYFGYHDGKLYSFALLMYEV
jgi:hypothetical protein